MKFVIWGCGIRGKRLLACMSNMCVEAFVDSDLKLIGTVYNGVPIVSFKEYVEKYQECYLIVSQIIIFPEIFKAIKEQHIRKYFVLSHAPKELPGWEGVLPFADMLAPLGDISQHRVILYGVNLFSVMLYEFIKDKTIAFFAHIDAEKEIEAELEKDGVRFIDMEDVNKKDDLILKTDSFLDKNSNINIDGVCFYRFPYLKEYDYPSLKQFCNIHVGERCFIVATGPSLKMSALERLYKNNEICISMNTIYKAFDQTKWRPKYFFYEDASITKEAIEKIKKVDIEYKFLADRRIKVADYFVGNNSFVYRTYSEYYEEEGPEFSHDVDEGTFFGYTVLYQCLQFALYMGFSTVYIIGADCEYKNFGGVGDHFIDDYEDIDKKGFLETDKIFAAYRVARREAEKKNVKIYNATCGGKLDVFERVDFDSLF